MPYNCSHKRTTACFKTQFALDEQAGVDWGLWRSAQIKSPFLLQHFTNGPLWWCFLTILISSNSEAVVIIKGPTFEMVFSCWTQHVSVGLTYESLAGEHLSLPLRLLLQLNPTLYLQQTPQNYPKIWSDQHKKSISLTTFYYWSFMMVKQRMGHSVGQSWHPWNT